MIAIYGFFILALTVYSYALVDPNLTLVSHPIWVWFREGMVQLGYYHRDYSWYIYLAIVLILFSFHFYFVKKYKEIPILKIAFITGIILLVSYPFLSHDLFNYIFDAKIFTYYGKNPYLAKPADFPSDEWLRFMHWTHRTYPYGPTYLILSFIPSFLGFGKFVLHFLFFKAFNIIFYILGVYFLNKIDKKSAVIFATHPLVIIEGLVNSHNDLVGVSLALIGVYYIMNDKNWFGRLFLLLSVGIKYITFPVLAVQKNNKLFISGAFVIQLLLLFYLSVYNEIQPWYYLTLFIYLPFFKDFIATFNIFLFGLLISYYPYIFLGGWDSKEKVDLKHYIIISFLVLNVLYILIKIKPKFYLAEFVKPNFFKK